MASFEAEIAYLLDAGVELSFPIVYELSTGEAMLSYGVADAFLQLPESLQPDESFSIDTGILTGAGDKARSPQGVIPELKIDDQVRFEFSAGLLFEWALSAGLDFNYEFETVAGDGNASISFLPDETDFSDDIYLPLVDISSADAASEAKGGLFDLLSSVTPFEQNGVLELSYAGLGFEVDLNNFKLFGDGFESSNEFSGADATFMTVLAEHIPDDAAITLSMDVDDFLGSVATLVPEPTTRAVAKLLENLDGDFDFPELSSSVLEINAEVGYSLLSLDLSLGLSPATKVSFTPDSVGVELVPSWGAGAEQGLLGDTFDFTAPSAPGDYSLAADYTLNGAFDFGLGVSLDPLVNLSVMTADGLLVATTPLVDLAEIEFDLGLYEETFLTEYSKEFYPEALSFEQDYAVPLVGDSQHQYDLAVA